MKKVRKATVAIPIREGKVLLGEKKKGEIGTGTVNGPGGKQEDGETLLECVIRESWEEGRITLFPQDLDLVAVITFFAEGEPDFEVYFYRTEHFVGEAGETEDMILDWYSVDDLPFDRMLEADRYYFEKAARGECFSANVYYKERAKGFERIEFLPPRDWRG